MHVARNVRRDTLVRENPGGMLPGRRDVGCNGHRCWQIEGSPERHHRRSRAETRMHGVKPPGQRLLERDVDRHLARLPVRAAVPNRVAAFGKPVTEAMG
jgi:hypothetical protein